MRRYSSMSKPKTTGVGARFGSNNRGSLLSQHGVADPGRVDNISSTEADIEKPVTVPLSGNSAINVGNSVQMSAENTAKENKENIVEATVIEETMSAKESTVTDTDNVDMEVQSVTHSVEEVQHATEAERFESIKQASLDAQIEDIGSTNMPDEVLQKKLQKAEQVAVQEAQSILGITYTNAANINANTYTQAAGPATPEAFQAHQDSMLADIASAIANETDPAVIQAMLREKMNTMTQDASLRQATCLPKSREDCLRCPCNLTCKRSLARYKIVTTSVRMTEDIKTALEIMVNEDMYQANITMSSVVSLALQAIVEPYLEEARSRIAAREKRLSELHKQGIYTTKR